MRRIKTLFLLFAFVLVMCTGAWAASSAKAVYISGDVAISQDIMDLLSAESEDFVSKDSILSTDIGSEAFTATSKDAYAGIISSSLKIKVSSDDMIAFQTFCVSEESKYILVSIDLDEDFANISASQFVVAFVGTSKAISADLINESAVKLSGDILLPSKFYVVAKLDKNVSFDMVATKVAEAEEENNEETNDEETETVSFERNALDLENYDKKDELLATLSDLGIEEEDLLAGDDVEVTNNTSLPETVTEEKIEAISNDKGYSVFDDIVLPTITVSATAKGTSYISPAFDMPEKLADKEKEFSKIAFFFIKVVAAVTSEAQVAADDVETIEATVIDASTGKEVTGDTAPEQIMLVADGLEKDTTYDIVAAEKIEAAEEEDDEVYTLTTDSTLGAKAEALFTTGYSDVEVLGVFEATKTGTALVSLDTKAFELEENQSVYLVDVSADTALNKGVMTLLSEDKTTEAATGDTAAYAKSKSDVTEDITYALVKATSSSSTNTTKKLSEGDLSEADETQEGEIDEAFEALDYNLQDILGVLTLDEDAVVIAPIKDEFTVKYGSHYVFFIEVSPVAAVGDDPVSATLLDNTQTKITTKNTEADYAKSDSTLTAGTYAMVSATKNGGISGSGGGCNAGFAGLAALAVLALIRRASNY